MTVLIADDHAAIRAGLKHILSGEFGGIKFSEASTAAQVMQKAITKNPDLIILDINLPGRSGLDVLKQLRSMQSTAPVLVFSFHQEEEFAVRALKAGANGFLSKDVPDYEFIKAITQILNGKKYISQKTAELMARQLGNGNLRPHELLSDREYQILILIASGKSITRIASEIALSVTTISTYRSRLLNKMHLKSNADITRYVIENKLSFFGDEDSV